MTPDTATEANGYAPEAPAKPAGKVRLLSLADLDRRTKAFQHVRETRDAVLADLGGGDQLSTLESLAADHVALTAAMLKDAGVRWLKGEQIDPAVIATLTNTFNRTAGVLGWQRRAKDVTPSVKDYLAGINSEAKP